MALLIALFASNLVDTPTFIFVVVGSALAWLWDMTDVLKLRMIPVNPIPLMIGATVTANGAYTWGSQGSPEASPLRSWCGLPGAFSIPCNVRPGPLPSPSLLAGSYRSHDRQPGSHPPLLDTDGHRRHRSGRRGRLRRLGRAAVRWRGWRARPEPRNGDRCGNRRPNQRACGRYSLNDDDAPGISRQCSRLDRRAGVRIATAHRNGHSHRRAPGLLTMFDAAVLGVPAFWAAIWVFA